MISGQEKKHSNKASKTKGIKRGVDMLFGVIQRGGGKKKDATKKKKQKKKRKRG